MTSPEIPQEATGGCMAAPICDHHWIWSCGMGLPQVAVCSQCHEPNRADVAQQIEDAKAAAALPHLRVHETASKCLDCEHTHTPDGCTGQPSPSDVWAGVTPSICDCPSLRVQETPEVLLLKAEALEEAVASGEFPGLTLAREWVAARAAALRARASECPSPHPRPVVAREALERILADHAVGRHVPKDAARYRTVIADGVLALTNGRTAKTEPL